MSRGLFVFNNVFLSCLIFRCSSSSSIDSSNRFVYWLDGYNRSNTFSLFGKYKISLLSSCVLCISVNGTTRLAFLCCKLPSWSLKLRLNNTSGRSLIYVPVRLAEFIFAVAFLPYNRSIFSSSTVRLPYIFRLRNPPFSPNTPNAV